MSGIAMVDCNCDYCGHLMSKRKADRERGWGRFCDKSCKALFASRGPKKMSVIPAPVTTPTCHRSVKKPRPEKVEVPKPEGYGGWA